MQVQFNLAFQKFRSRNTKTEKRKLLEMPRMAVDYCSPEINPCVSNLMYIPKVSSQPSSHCVQFIGVCELDSQQIEESRKGNQQQERSMDIRVFHLGDGDNTIGVEQPVGDNDDEITHIRHVG